MRLRAFLLSLVLLLATPVAAQHQIDPENWIEMRKMYREKHPATSIAEDVAALAGPDARRAGPRLIDRGAEVLPLVHAALLAPDVEPRHAMGLLQVIGPLAEESSVPVVLELLRRDPRIPFRRDALLILTSLPVTDAAADYIAQLAADDDEPWRTRRMAFAWYGLQRDPRGRPAAEALRTSPEPERRVAGLFVLARLGDETVLEPISEILATGATANSRDTLFMALAELTSPEEFERRVPEGFAGSRGYKDSLRYARYRTGSPAERPALCLEMLHAQMPGHREVAVRCLLDSGRAADLRPYAAVDLEAPGRDALVRNEIRRAGWRVVDTDTEFDIVPGAPVVGGSP
jgi:HEAT repeat protein